MMAQGTPSRQQMLKWVDMLSFAVQEANLYLDTHPSDQAALAYFQEYNQLRCQALNDYAALYGPLTIGKMPVSVSTSFSSRKPATAGR